MRRRTKLREKRVGVVIDYDAVLRRAKVKLSGTLRVGDNIRIKGRRTDYQQRLTAMRIGDKPVAIARADQIVWIDVIKRVDKTDQVFILLAAGGQPSPPRKPDPKRPDDEGPDDEGSDGDGSNDKGSDDDGSDDDDSDDDSEDDDSDDDDSDDDGPEDDGTDDDGSEDGGSGDDDTDDDGSGDDGSNGESPDTDDDDEPPDLPGPGGGVIVDSDEKNKEGGEGG